MAITVREMGRSRSISENRNGDGEGTLAYVASGSTDVDDIELAVLTKAPATFRDMKLDSYSINPLKGDSWDAKLKYNTRKLDDGEYRISFDTTGAMARVTQAFDYTDYTIPGTSSTAKDSKGAIQVNAEGRVEGVDVGIGQLNLTVRARIPADFITQDYIDALTDLTYTTNFESYLGYAAGRLLFLGVQGDITIGQSTDLNFMFAVGRHIEDLTLGEIEGIDKAAHDYIWITYEDQEDDNSNSLVSVPKHVHVDQVYLPGNFNLLYIGVVPEEE